MQRRTFLLTSLASFVTLLTSTNSSSSNDPNRFKQPILPIQSKVRIYKPLDSSIYEASQIKVKWEQTVNSTMWLDAPAGTWLCKDVKFTPVERPFGGHLPTQHQFEFFFHYRIEGWGVPISIADGYTHCYYSANSKKIYHETDFNEHFDFWKQIQLN